MNRESLDIMNTVKRCSLPFTYCLHKHTNILTSLSAVSEANLLVSRSGSWSASSLFVFPDTTIVTDFSASVLLFLVLPRLPKN